MFSISSLIKAVIEAPLVRAERALARSMGGGAFMGQHTNPERRSWRNLVKSVGIRQAKKIKRGSIVATKDWWVE